ncbi:nucleotidyl transferase AbiEii/AbiGii toxin family protein [Carboxylicivirga sediminis]|uniref:Nucleotidyl transferase AbiEii/AbiGii toxin family protein n=1 Tax=Carboxylicivirga sediminis TaxID=2006564 RepID=A0A941IXJ7_9BACT|nr:nucleotidyl transferase AbiEii/AbiGii toxin family protein [Carboxylicivirga sediminis]MBR8536115.1 nucleotidyl transferase AbiEii/AbiGii toxin family protein [Carboxylicivirga sediminis]
MTGITFYKIKPEERNSIFEAIGNNIGIPASAVEKDWWVVQTLALIQELEAAPHIVFKGGTSLSKAWRIIERFSEDIDLALDKSFLGIEECTTVKQVKKLRSATRKYIYDSFIPELQNKFNEVGFTDIKVELYEEEGENLEPVQILVKYETCTSSSSYTKPEVKIEIGSRSLREPFTNCVFSSLVGEHYKGKPFADDPISVGCVNPERTFLEKLFLLHEEFQKPENEIRVDRLSRHLYDVEMLMRTKYAEIALANNELYNEIIEHRKVYTKISNIDYSGHQPKSLNPLPPDAVINSWRRDYQRMQEEMIYGTSLLFDELIERIKLLKERINNSKEERNK